MFLGEKLVGANFYAFCNYGRLIGVHGIVVGAFGEGSDDLHTLIQHLVVSRVRFAEPQLGRRGQLRTEEAEIASTSFLRKSLSVCALCSSRPSPSPSWTACCDWAMRSSSPEEEQCPPFGKEVGPAKAGGCTRHLSSLI